MLQEAGSAGMMDFFTPVLGLALEMTRDGRGIGERCECFLDEDRYAPLMQANIIREHAIVDLRSTSTSTAQRAVSKVPQPHLYTVLFSEDCKMAEIHHMYSVTSIVMAGNAGQEAREILAAH